MLEFRSFIERSVFGVCQSIGTYLGIAPAKIRLYFIYTSVLTFGSPLVLYLVSLFWLNIQRHLRRSNNPLLD